MDSGDRDPIHLAAEYARGTPYGQGIAHGVPEVAIVTGMFDRLGIFEESALALLGVDEWCFVAPILVGEPPHMKLAIAGKRLTSNGNCSIINGRIWLVRWSAPLGLDRLSGF